MSGPIVIRAEELAIESAELLPPRETLGCQIGCVNVSNVVGVNLAIAVNAATVNSAATATANQYLGSWQ